MNTNNNKINLLFICLIVIFIAGSSMGQNDIPVECQVEWEDRDDCQRYSELDCESVGCCWVPSYEGGPAWCFYPDYNSQTSLPGAPTNRPTQKPPTQCNNFNGQNSGTVSCSGGQQTQVPSSELNRRWQTPKRGSAGYMESYQDYSDLVGYPRVVYDSSRSSATVEVIAFHRDSDVNNVTLLYVFDSSSPSESPILKVDSSYKNELQIYVFSSAGFELYLEPVHFIWNNPIINLPSNYINGSKGAIVDLFGWPYNDIAKECEMLGKAGYLAVKVFVQSEHVSSYQWLQNGYLNPWYFIYQPVSYKLTSRLGTREELRDMIQTCRSHNVRVYGDAVINHMSGGGNDILNHCNNNDFWSAKESDGFSPYMTHPYTYQTSVNTGNKPGNEFPSVPYGPTDFHCERGLSSWTDPFSLNYGWLVGLTDLATETPYVQQRIADYLTDMIGLGFSGFRMDAAKHIQPRDIAQILARFKTNMGGSLPADFNTYLEVLMGGEAQLLACDANSGYNYYLGLDNELQTVGFTQSERNQVKIWSSDYPKEHPICGYWILPSERFVVQQDDHDQQKPGSSSRDMQDKGTVLVMSKDIDRHRAFNEELFSRTDGNWQLKVILSSYTLMNTGSGDWGFPDGKSDCSRYTGSPTTCYSVPYSPAYQDTCGYSVEGWVGGKYTRTHRDKRVILKMRAWLGLSTDVSNGDIGLPSECN